MTNSNRFLFLILVGLFAFGCSRPSLENKSTIRLSIPNQSKMDAYSTLEAAHAIVNISGPDMPNPILWDWDACPQGCFGNTSRMTLPSSITLDVPANHDYLVQVLVAYEDSSTGQMEFDYGDSSNSDTLSYVRIKDPDVSIPIYIQSISNGGGKMVHIKGRYLDTTNSGPSGRVGVYYQPAGNKPRMKIMNTFMYSGFSEFFAVDGLAFDYILEDQRRLLLTGFTPSSPDLVASPHLLYVNQPSSIYRLDMSSGSAVYYPSGHQGDSDLKAIGYFGSGVQNVSVCYDSVNSQIAINNYAISATGTPLYYSGSNYSASTINVNGGVNPCPQGTENENFMKFRYQNFDFNNGVNFWGAFLAQTSTGSMNQGMNFVAVESQSTTSAILKWTYVPGLIVDRTAIFQNDNFTSDMERVLYRENGIDCNKLFGLGFYSVGEVAGTQTTLSNMTSGKTEVVICPVINGKLLSGIDAGLRWHTISSQNCPAGYYRDASGNCQPSVVQTGYGVRSYSFPMNTSELITTGSCKNIDIELTSGSAQTLVTAGSTMNFKVISGSVSSGTFYQGFNCNTANQLTTSGYGDWPYTDDNNNPQMFSYQYRDTSWPASASHLQLSFRAGPVNFEDHFIFQLDLGASFNNPAVHADTCVGSPCSNNNGGNPYVRFEPLWVNTNVSPIQSDNNGNYRIKNNACYQVKASLYNVSSGSGPSPHYYVTGGSGVSVAISTASYANLSFYTAPDCSSGSVTGTNLYISTGSTDSQSFGMRYNMAVVSSTFSLNFSHMTSSDGTISFGNGWQNVNYFFIDPNISNGTGNGSTVNLGFGGSQSRLSFNDCTRFEVTVGSGVSTSVYMNVTGGTIGYIFDNPRCTNPVPYPVSVNSKRDLYYLTNDTNLPHYLSAGTVAGIYTATLQITTGSYEYCSSDSYYDPMFLTCSSLYTVRVEQWNGSSWMHLINNFSMPVNACVPARMSFFEKLGNDAVNITNASFSVSADISLSQGTFYTDSSCSTVTGGSLTATIPYNNISSGSFYIRNGYQTNTNLSTAISAPTLMMGPLPTTSGSFY